ncbi:unnamed protein product [Soboliphyme baturini]|uniref:Uncharacterized protein n=1 Tax=Soboliphyme baturini TaxID=241478 RepID=A0A183J884_9BILA|nr:unnamed protein product [Soboliphyme baturini]
MDDGGRFAQSTRHGSQTRKCLDSASVCTSPLAWIDFNFGQSSADILGHLWNYAKGLVGAEYLLRVRGGTRTTFSQKALQPSSVTDRSTGRRRPTVVVRFFRTTSVHRSGSGLKRSAFSTIFVPDTLSSITAPPSPVASDGGGGISYCRATWHASLI